MAGPSGTGTVQSPPGDAPAIDSRELARPVAERLLEDETLRGDLSDTAYGPVLDWVLALVRDAADRAATMPEPAAVMDQAGDAARALVRAITRAAERGDPSLVLPALAPPLLTEEQRTRAVAALPTSLSEASSADDRARLIIAALSVAVPGRNA